MRLAVITLVSGRPPPPPASAGRTGRGRTATGPPRGRHDGGHGCPKRNRGQTAHRGDGQRAPRRPTDACSGGRSQCWSEPGPGRRSRPAGVPDVDCVPGGNTLARYAETATDGALLCGTLAYLPPSPLERYRLSTIPSLAPPHAGRPTPGEREIVRSGDHRLFWSLSFTLTARTWRDIGGFYENGTGYGGEDTDFALTAASRGVDLWWIGGAPAYHQHHPVSRPPAEHLDDILRNGAIFKERWGTWPMQGWLRDFADLGLVVYERHTDTWRKTPAAR